MKKVVLIDNDTSYVLPLKSEFEKADYEVIYFDDSQKAREALHHLVPDIILCEVELPQINGHALFKELRSLTATKSVPFIFLSSQKRVDDRIKSMELGVDDYIVKPCSIEEIMARVRALLREINEANEHQSQPEKGFSGNLTEMNLVDLIQTLELGKKSAVVKLTHHASTGLVYLKNGEVIDATLNSLPPDQALLRMFTWTVGAFAVEMNSIERERTIKRSNKELIAVGLRRINEWEQIKENLPALNTVVMKTDLNNYQGLTEEEQHLLATVDKKSMIYEMIQRSHTDDIKALEIVKSLLKKGYLKETDENYLSYTDNYLAQLKEHASKSRSSSNRVAAIMANFFNRSDQPAGGSEQPKVERRQLPDRRRYLRRRFDRIRETGNIHLTKAELLLIRERLL